MIAKKNWMLVTIASLGLTVAVPLFAQDANPAEPKREEIRLNQLPDGAARAIRDAAAGKEVVTIYSITEGNQTFYRARINDKGADKWVQVGREGRLQEIDDADGRVRTRLNNIPEGARQAIEREAKDQKVTEVFAVTQGNETFYHAHINTPRGERIIQVGKEGRIQEVIRRPDRSLRAEPAVADRRTGQPAQPAAKAQREVVRLRDLPEDARKAIQKVADGREIKEIHTVTDGNQTYYEARIFGSGKDQIVQVGKEGRILENTHPTRGPVLASERGERRRLPERQQRSFEGWKREKVDPDRLPGAVKQALGENDVKLDQLSEAWVNTRDGRTVYSVVEASPSREILHRVSADGKILSENNVTPQGRERVEFDRLPGPVKGELQKHGNANDYTRIFAVTEGNETWFAARHRNGEVYRVGREGNVIDD